VAEVPAPLLLHVGLNAFRSRAHLAFFLQFSWRRVINSPLLVAVPLDSTISRDFCFPLFFSDGWRPAFLPCPFLLAPPPLGYPAFLSWGGSIRAISFSFWRMLGRLSYQAQSSLLVQVSLHSRKTEILSTRFFFPHADFLR